MFVLGMLVNCSDSRRAYFLASGTDARTSEIGRRISYPSWVPGSFCSPAIVPPVASTSTRGRSDCAVAETGTASINRPRNHDRMDSLFYGELGVRAKTQFQIGGMVSNRCSTRDSRAPNGC